MRQTTVAGTDLRVSRISFGTASLHHVFSASARQTLLETAADLGVTHFDTAPLYGYGLAEVDLGKFLHSRRHGFTLTTKVGLYPWGGAARHASSVWARKGIGRAFRRVALPVVDWHLQKARASLHASLRRLGVDRVDLLLLHEPIHALINTDEFQLWLEDEVSRGLIRYWGIAGEPERIIPWLNGLHIFARVVQTRDSLAAREADFLLSVGRSLQFTYGYLSATRPNGQAIPAVAVLRSALERNSCGSIIISSTAVGRLSETLKCAE
jgi:aryl-alcohol dehydrogenase-like predicted oxidoreductase